MFNNSSTNLVHLPRRPPPSPDHLLPRGQCRFVLPETEADGSHPRCCCQTFWLKKDVPGSMCECGHQAWHHLSDPSGSCVSMEEFATLQARVKQLEADRDREVAKRDSEYQVLRKSYQIVIENVKRLKLLYDDRIEDMVDKIQRTALDVDGMRRKLEDVDDATMNLENRVDLLDQQKTSRSRSMTPIVESATEHVVQIPEPDHPLRAAPSIPIQPDRKPPQPWSVRLNLVLHANQHFAFEYNSKSYRRLEGRNMNQEVQIPDRNASSFAKAVDSVYWPIFNGRPWMPMMCYRSNPDDIQSRLVLQLLPEGDREPAHWDFELLEEKCVAKDKMQGAIIHIVLQSASISWAELRMLPVVPGADESCWAHDPVIDIDNDNNAGVDVQMDFKMDFSKEPAAAGNNRLHDYSDPPPTYSRAYTEMDRLEVLATLAGHHSRADMEVHSLTSLESRETDDSHRDKKPKLRTKKSDPTMSASASMNAGASNSQAPIYLSGRSKRKMPANYKNKEPVRFPTGNWKSPLPSLLHRHDGKDKGGAAS